MSERISKNLRLDFFESVINKDVAFFDEKRTGDLSKSIGNLFCSVKDKFGHPSYSRLLEHECLYVREGKCVHHLHPHHFVYLLACVDWGNIRRHPSSNDIRRVLWYADQETH